MAKVKNELISDLNVSWENYAGSSVESFIKDQLRKAVAIYTEVHLEKEIIIICMASNVQMISMIGRLVKI